MFYHSTISFSRGVTYRSHYFTLQRCPLVLVILLLITILNSATAKPTPIIATSETQMNHVIHQNSITLYSDTNFKGT